MNICIFDERWTQSNRTVILAEPNPEGILRNLLQTDANKAQDSFSTAVTTAFPEIQILKDDVTWETTDLFCRLMTEEVEMDDVPTENTTDAKSTNEDQQPPTKAQIEYWVDGRFKRNYYTFLDHIFNAVGDKFSDTLRIAAKEFSDNQPTESDLYRIQYAMVADILDDARIEDALSKIPSTSIRKLENMDKGAQL